MKRPPCPMCDGTAMVPSDVPLKDVTKPCPECMEDPGLASWDRIMAIANAVIDDVDGYGYDTMWRSVREYLMHGELSKR